MSESIQPSAKNNVLRDACGDRSGELFFRMTTSRGHKCAKSPRHGAQLLFSVQSKVPAEQRHSDRIDQHARLIQNLMRCAPHRYAKCRFAGPPRLHAASVPARTMKHMAAEEQNPKTNSLEKHT